ncbi:MAG: LysM peptidoglycan-binding domain-containing protein [Cyanobacteria bacterium SZAS TMP-1]|nr:LysM peptidoglycan-binding domain-containing protein [Cyanobacteria bacterium SZAS TMP-1]
MQKNAPTKDQGHPPEATEHSNKPAGTDAQTPTSAIHSDSHGADALAHTRAFKLSAEKHDPALPPVDLVGAELKRDGTAQHYVVKKGDTLSDIARRQLPPDASNRDIYNQVREIARANHIANPDRIPVGLELNLPEKHSARPVAGGATDTRPPAAADTRPPAAADTNPPGAADTRPPAATDTRPPVATDTRPPAAATTTPTDAAPTTVARAEQPPAVPELTPEQKKAATLVTVTAIEKALGSDNPDPGPSFGDVPAMPTGPITDTRKIMQLLADKSPAEIKAISDTFAEKYGKDHGGRTLEAILADRLSGTDKSKAIDLFHRHDKADDAGRIHTALEEMHEWGGRSSTNCQKDIRDTMATMNSAQIAELKRDYEARYGHKLEDDLAGNKKISDETRAALAIYAKGSDNRTPADTIALANIATRAKSLDMFQEAFRDASPEARTQYMAQGGAEKMKTAFGGWVSDSDLRKAEDYVNSGKLDVVTKIKDNTGVFSSNDKAIDTAIGAMSQTDRDQYGRGKAVAGTFQEYTYDGTSEMPVFNTEAYNKLSAEQKVDYDRYRALHEAMQSAGNSIKVARWEDMIANKGETLATTLAQHGGLWSDKVDKALTDIEKMSKDDFDRLKRDPAYRKEVEAALAMNYSGDDLKRAQDLLTKKLSHESYEQGGQSEGTRTLLQSVQDKDGFFSTDKKGIIAAVEHMSEADQRRYREDPQYKKELDQAVMSALGPSPDATAVMRILDHVSKGEGAREDIISKLSLHVNGDKSTPQMLAEIEAAIKEDPNLRNRILNPVTDEDKTFSAHFKQLARIDFGGDYSKYVEPLLKNGSLPFEEKAKLYDGFWSNDTKGLYDAIGTATPAERAAIAADPHKMLPFLTPEQSALAGIIAKQNGEMRPEDKMRAAILGMSGDKEMIRELGTTLKPEERVKLVHDYEAKYGVNLITGLDDKLSGSDRTEAERNFRDLPDSARAAFNAARDQEYVSNDGIGRSFVRHWDGTSDMTRDDLNQYAASMSNYSRAYQEMPLAERQKMTADLNEAVDLYRKSKGAAADATVDGLIIVGGVGGAVFTGGVSLGLIATTGLVGATVKVGTKAAVMGADYDSSRAGIDAATGAVDAVTMVVGPGEVAKILGIGGKAAATATDLALVEAGTIAKATGRQILKEGAETTLKKELTGEVSTALAHGASEINEKTLQRMAEKYASSPEDVAAVKELLTKNLNQAIATESGTALKATLREVALNSGAGSAAGGTSSLVRGVSEWDSSKSVDENLQALAETTAMGTLMGGAMGGGATVGFKALGKSFAMARLATAEAARATNEGVDIMSGVVRVEDHIKLDRNGRVAEVHGLQTAKIQYHESGLFQGQVSRVDLGTGTKFENIGENKWRIVSHEHPEGLEVAGNVRVMTNGEVHVNMQSGDRAVHYPNGLITYREASGNVRTITEGGKIVSVQARSGHGAEYGYTGEGKFDGVEYQNGRSVLRDQETGHWMVKETADAPATRFDGTVTVDEQGVVRMKPADGAADRVLRPDGSSSIIDAASGKPTQINYADGTVRKFEYDAEGNIEKYFDPSGDIYMRYGKDGMYQRFDAEGKAHTPRFLHLKVAEDGVFEVHGKTHFTDGRTLWVDKRNGQILHESVPEGYSRDGRTLDAGGRPSGDAEGIKRAEYLDEHFSTSAYDRGDSIRLVSRELEDVKAIGFDGKPTSAYDSLMKDPSLSDAQKNNILTNMSIVREHFASYRSGEYMHGDPEVNWIHTQGEMAKALEVGRANHLTPRELEDSLLASMYSDSIKFGFPPPKGATSNFFTHHLDGANAAKTALEAQGFPPERVNLIVGAIKAHQISPPNLMGELYHSAITRRLNEAIASQQISAAEGERLQKVLKDMTEVGADGKARIKVISNVREQPRFMNADGHMELSLTDDERKVLSFSGTDSWTVPYDVKRDPNFRQLSAAEREEFLTRQRVHQAVIDADGLDNYATVGGASKFIAIRGPETGFKDAVIWDSLRSTDASFRDSYSLMSPEARKIADRNWSIRTIETNPEGSPLKTKMEDWLRSQGKDPSKPIPFYNSELKYPTADALAPGEKNLPGLNDQEMKDYLFAKEIKAKMVDLLRAEQRVDGSLPGTFDSVKSLRRPADMFLDRSPSRELTFPGKRPEDIAPGESFVTADKSITAARAQSGELVVTNHLDNSVRRFDANNRMLELENGDVNRKFVYDSKGRVSELTTTSKSDGTQTIFSRKESDGSWSQTNIDAAGNRHEAGRVHVNDMVIEPDGSFRRYHAADSREVYDRHNIDGSIDMVKTTGRIEYVKADYALERQRFDKVIAQQFADKPERMNRINELVASFEAHAGDKGRELSVNDKALFYKQLNRLLADSPTAVIPMAQRADLAEQALNHSAHPWTVDQGANGTCNVTTVEHRNYWRNPDKNVQVLADIAETGRYQFADGRTVELRDVAGEIKPDYEARYALARQHEGRSLTDAEGAIKGDGKRDYSSQLLETAMANYAWAERTEIVSVDGRMLKPEDYRMRYDSKGKAIGIVDHEHVTVLSDKDGIPLTNYNPGDEVFDQYKRPIKRVPQDRLIFDKDNRAVGFVDKMDNVKMAFDGNGKPIGDSPLSQPGSEVYDADGKLMVRHTVKGELHYEKVPGSARDHERVMIDLKGNSVRLRDNDGKAVNHPNIGTSQLRDISRGVNNNEPRAFIIDRNAVVGEGANQVTIDSEANFIKAINVMEAENNLPAVMMVNSSKPPFNQPATFDSKGRFDGWHVINVHSVEHVTDPVTGETHDIIHFTNQWGSKADYLDRGVDAKVLYESMQRTPDIEVKPKPIDDSPAPDDGADKPGRLRRLWNKIKPYFSKGT